MFGEKPCTAWGEALRAVHREATEQDAAMPQQAVA